MDETGGGATGERSGDGWLSARQVLGVIVGFGTDHLSTLQRRAHVVAALGAAVLVAIWVVVGSTPVRALVVLAAVVGVGAWAITSLQLFAIKKALRRVAEPVRVVSPDQARDVLATALGLPGLAPWPLARMLWRWVRRPEVRQAELATVVDRLRTIRSNPEDLLGAFTPAPD